MSRHENWCAKSLHGSGRCNCGLKARKGKQRNRPVTKLDEYNIENALYRLKAARLALSAAQANNAAAYVARAIKSTQGALRHVRGRLDRQARENVK